jgi:hypothetical protein
MASHVGGTHAGPATRGPSPAVAGWTLAAAVLMIFGGALAIFEGIAAIADDRVFSSTGQYSYEFSLNGWGITHIVLGSVIFVAGLALFTGAMWARVVGVVLAGLSMIANFMWLPYTPIWAVILIVIDGFIIWGLCSPRREPHV